MKVKAARNLTIITLLTLLFVNSMFGASATAYADSGSADGWEQHNGKTRYIMDGQPIAKDAIIDGVRYTFNADGYLTGKYTGWTRDSEYRYYYSDGVCQTGWMELNSKTYYFNRDGKMRTGYAVIFSEAHPMGKTYYFDENGVFSGLEYFPYEHKYKPATLKEYLLDHDFSVGSRINATRTHGRGFAPFNGAVELNRILAAHKNEKMVYGHQDHDVIFPPEGIYKGGDILQIVRVNDTGSNAYHIFFSKDEDGKCYLFDNWYIFGVALKDDTAYDVLKSLIPPNNSNADQPEPEIEK